MTPCTLLFNLLCSSPLLFVFVSNSPKIQDGTSGKQGEVLFFFGCLLFCFLAWCGSLYCLPLWFPSLSLTTLALKTPRRWQYVMKVIGRSSPPPPPRAFELLKIGSFKFASPGTNYTLGHLRSWWGSYGVNHGPPPDSIFGSSLRL